MPLAGAKLAVTAKSLRDSNGSTPRTEFPNFLVRVLEWRVFFLENTVLTCRISISSFDRMNGDYHGKIFRLPIIGERATHPGKRNFVSREYKNLFVGRLPMRFIGLKTAAALRR
jgi:hypothetical protein